MTGINQATSAAVSALAHDATDLIFSPWWGSSRYLDEVSDSFSLMPESAIAHCVSRLAEYDAKSIEFCEEANLIQGCLEYVEFEDGRDKLNTRAIFVLVEIAPVLHAFKDYVESMHDSVQYRMARIAINLALRVKDYDSLQACARGYALEAICVGPCDFNTPLQRWLTEKAVALTEHAETLVDRHSVDPEWCESLLNTPRPLAEGNL